MKYISCASVANCGGLKLPSEDSGAFAQPASWTTGDSISFGGSLGDSPFSFVSYQHGMGPEYALAILVTQVLRL